MKIKSILSGFVAAVITLGASTAFAGGDAWSSDFEKASAQAKKEGKYMLLDFTGSDWCGWCIKLNKEVFSHDEFKDYAKEQFVLVELDFPRKKQIPADTVEQNRRLQKKYGIRGFPTIIVLSPEGELVARTGYKPGGPDAYVTHLKAIVAKHKAGDSEG